MLPVPVVCAFACLYISAGLAGIYLPGMPAVVTFGLLAHVTWSVWWGYRRYLRMPHASAVAVTSQLMAALATCTISQTILPNPWISYVLQETLDLLGLW
jgi:hypothetical protein